MAVKRLADYWNLFQQWDPMGKKRSMTCLSVENIQMNFSMFNLKCKCIYCRSVELTLQPLFQYVYGMYFLFYNNITGILSHQLLQNNNFKNLHTRKRNTTISYKLSNVPPVCHFYGWCRGEAILALWGDSSEEEQCLHHLRTQWHGLCQT